VVPTPEQYERYSDGSHRGKKKIEESEKAEAERRIAEARTKAVKRPKRMMVPVPVRRQIWINC